MPRSGARGNTPPSFLEDDVRVDVQTLPTDQVERLRDAPFTYADIGATANTPPPGYDSFSRSRIVNHTGFDAAAENLMTWQVHRRPGLKVAASSPTVTADTVVLMRLGVGPAALRIPCRVVYVVDQPGLRGFAYGTLPGHPESGEESFLVRKFEDGHVEFTVSAFSKPATRITRLGGPLARGFQRLMTSRYLNSLDN
jgi:uncharacterized protein (UPF0548 family)